MAINLTYRAFRAAALVATLATLVTLVVGVSSAPAGAVPSSIAGRGSATVVSHASESTRAITLRVPSGAVPGDVLIATLGVGRTGASRQTRLTPPTGWNLVRRTNHGTSDALAAYWHVLANGESSFTWSTDQYIGGTGILAAFGGVDRSNPVDVSQGRATPQPGTTLASPSVTTSRPGEVVVATWYGHSRSGRATSWHPAGTMTELADVNNGASRSASLAVTHPTGAGATGAKAGTASLTQDHGIAMTLALRPRPTPTSPVPLIVDTDLFSDADDVGALATAFALQRAGEARVLAIGVNTRTSRPSVARNSWRCAAAIAQFYGAGSTPIGTHKPDNGTATNTDEFVGPCATRAAGNTPTPDTAVRVFRRALASQANGSVVMVGIGYFRNLSDLLASPADSISPLTGRQLITQKVRQLVVMAGGFPSRSSETNLVGDIAAAQDVANHWPTRIEWAGYEVGDVIHTGQTITARHPSTSPVRISYEAFVGPNKWIYSYDLVAVYHAVRETDARLTPIGWGRNVVNNSGGNSFVYGSGNQYFLRLSDGATLAARIETLLGVHP